MSEDIVAISVSAVQRRWLEDMLTDRTEPFDDVDCGWQILQAVYDALPVVAS